MLKTLLYLTIATALAVWSGYFRDFVGCFSCTALFGLSLGWVAWCGWMIWREG